MKTARQILHKYFPTCKIQGREDLIDYNPNQLVEHFEETIKDGTAKWLKFTKWTESAGFIIHQNKITFWARYTQIRDWCNCGERIDNFTIYTT